MDELSDMLGSTKNAGICLCASISIFLGVAIVLISLDSVEPLEIGLEYDMISKSVNEDVYHGGLYMIGPLSYFIKFPYYHKTITFSSDFDANAAPLRTRTAEGLELYLYFSF